MAAALLLAAPAFADEPLPALPPAPSAPGTSTSASATVDAVHLRNGGLFRGRVTEIVPGDHVTILVEKGEPKKIPWSEIDRVIVASAPPPASSASPADPTGVGARTIPQATPAAPAPMVGPKARVHINSPNNVILYRRAAGTSNWTQACTSPCDLELPLGDSYRVAGNGTAQSKDISISGAPGSTVTITVDPPSTGGMIMGGLLAGAGVTAGYIGLLVVAVSFDGTAREERLRTGGLVAMGLGTVATVGGLVMFLMSAKTDITTSSSGGKSNDAFRRDPLWRTADTTRLPAPQYPLLFSHAF